MANTFRQGGLDSPQQAQLPRVRTVLIGFVVLFTILMIATIILHYRGQGPDVMSSTSLTLPKNFAEVHDNEVLAYNGMAFYSTNFQTGQRKVLNAGRKLPTISSLQWIGNHGALMVFKDNFYGTPVNGFITSEKLTLNATTKNYTWYLDFDSNKFSVISSLPLNASTTYYDETAKTLYYSTETTVGGKQAVRIYSYKLDDKPAKLLLSTTSITGISNIAKCSASPLFCIVANKTASDALNHVFAVDAQGKFHDVLSSADKIASANYPNYYTTSVLTQPAALHDISKNKTYNLGFKIDQNIHFAFTSGTIFYMFDAQDTGTYQTGKLEGSSATLKKHDTKLGRMSYKVGIIGIHGTGINGTSAITGADGAQYLFGPQAYTSLNTTATAQAAESSVKDCAKATSAAETYTASTRTFQVRFEAKDGFASSIKQFASCMTSKHSDAMHGYNYSLVGISPTDFKVIAP